jgi:hypothetical protein
VKRQAFEAQKLQLDENQRKQPLFEKSGAKTSSTLGLRRRTARKKNPPRQSVATEAKPIR